MSAKGKAVEVTEAKEMDEETEKMGEGGGHQSIAKIREILFGNQMRDYDDRFSQLQDRLIQAVNGLKEDTQAALGSVESELKNQVERLDQELAVGRQARDDGTTLSTTGPSTPRGIPCASAYSPAAATYPASTPASKRS